jgi:hypothetical protein
MPKISLPDGSERQYDATTSGADIAASIGEGLARAAVAIRVDGDLWDLNREISDDAEVAIITRDSEEGIELLRHDAAHVLAEAVKELWPETQVTIGPAIDNGFYYDFARKEPFTDADLETIEKRMQEIVDRDEVIEREVWERDKAAEFFRGIGEEYKAEIIESIPSDEDTARANSSTCAAALTCHRPASWARHSSSHTCQVPIGAAIRITKCCNAFTAPPGQTTKRCASICTCSRKPKSVIIAVSVALWIFSISRRRPRAQCFGTQTAGPYTSL